MIDLTTATITTEEFADRLSRTQAAMRQDGYDVLLAWSDCYRMSNVRWIADYRAFDGVIPYAALVVIPAKGEPTLFSTEGMRSSAKGSSWLKDVRGIRTELAPMLREIAASGNVRKVGIAGYRYLAVETWDVIRQSFPEHIRLEPTSLIDKLKSVKSEGEIHNMRVAGLLADVGCEAVRETARIGVTERELARAAYSAMFSQGADGIAFDVFVQIGENAEKYWLYRPTDRALRDGDVLMIDMGCRFAGYASDNARGAAFGNVSKDAQRLLDVCLEAYETGLRHLRPGITGDEACAPALEVLVRHGYMKPGQSMQCGHGTGMDPEEEYPVIHTGSDTVLLENQAIAYAITAMVPGVGGCRVEDPVIIRSSGPETLSKYPYKNNWPS